MRKQYNHEAQGMPDRIYKTIRIGRSWSYSTFLIDNLYLPDTIENKELFLKSKKFINETTRLFKVSANMPRY